MKISHQTAKDGWDIYTSCREDNPQDWNPGDPIRYAARGFAEFARPHEFNGAWSSKNRLDHPEVHFSDFNKAHDAVEADLRKRIEELKVQ